MQFVIAVNNKEIPLITVTFYMGFDAMELGSFGFELCACAPDEVQAVFRCYLHHARLLEIYFRTCRQQMLGGVSADELNDLLNWDFLSEREIEEVTHTYNMQPDSQYRLETEEFYRQQKRERKESEKQQRQSRPTYIYLMRDSATNHIKIGHSI